MGTAAAIHEALSTQAFSQSFGLHGSRSSVSSSRYVAQLLFNLALHGCS
jgi:hypothetical protein